MAEQIQNNSASTLNGGINNVVTSLTVTNGAVFPASGNFRILVDSELMLCTARAGNVLTVTRNVESTSAASHSNGAAVTHVLTTLGLTNFIAEHSISQTIADAKGDIITATAADTMGRKAVGADKTILMADSSQADGLIWGGTWTTYVPTWAASGTAPALGNGTLVGRYVQVGKTVMGAVILTMGSTTTFGTGSYTISLPVAPNSSMSWVALGTYRLFDSSSGNVYGGFVIWNAASSMAFETAAQPAVAVGQLVPMTWAVSDVLQATFKYEAA